MKLLFSIKKSVRKNNILFFPLVFLFIFLSFPAYADKIEKAETATNTATANVMGIAQNVKAANVIVTPLSKKSNSYLLQLFSGLLVVLVSIIVLAWVAKRFTHMQSGNNAYLQIIGSISMGSRERVVVVQAGATKVLLGVSPGRVNMLHVLDENNFDDEKNPDSLLSGHGHDSVDMKNMSTGNKGTGRNKSTGIVDKIKFSDLTSTNTRSFSQNLAATLLRKKS